MCIDDDRHAEADDARQETAGQHHQVTAKVTVEIQVTVTLPGSTHTDDELWVAAADEDCIEGEITEVEEL